MKSLGAFLRKYLRSDFEPFFMVSGEGSPERGFRIPLTETMISDMCLRGSFSMAPIGITVPKELSATNIYLCLQIEPYPFSADAYLPISGFPRELMSEDTNTQGRSMPD